MLPLLAIKRAAACAVVVVVVVVVVGDVFGAAQAYRLCYMYCAISF